MGLDEVVELAVAVDVEDKRRPALRLGGVAGLVKHSGVDPARHWPGAAHPQGLVGVVAELRMVGAEAGVDKSVFHRLWIEHRGLARRAIQRKHFGRGMLRALLAERRIVHTAAAR